MCLAIPAGASTNTTRDSYFCYAPLDLGAVMNAAVKNEPKAMDRMFSSGKCLWTSAGLKVTVLGTEVEGMRCKVRLSHKGKEVEGYMFCVGLKDAAS